VLKNVLLIVTLLALEIVDGKVSCERAGRATQEMLPTDSKLVMDRVDKRVKPFRPNVPPIEPRELLLRLVMFEAPSEVRSPVICCGPSSWIIPTAEELMTTLPEMVEHDARAVTSACELMVAVA
jgi:hypothetical protein